MPEILFRGKRKEHDFFGLGGEWVYGIPIKTHIGIFICFEENPHYCNQYGYMEIEEISKVIPETVGAFTGLTDKNGVKIFEGDIVKEYKSKDKVKGVVKFGEYQSGINKYADDLGFYVEWTTENFLIQELGYWCRKNMLEVIGNVHDNPELLEGSNK
jgi:uncharacterized phage protein (TIGR01671 family)